MPIIIGESFYENLLKLFSVLLRYDSLRLTLLCLYSFDLEETLNEAVGLYISLPFTVYSF